MFTRVNIFVEVIMGTLGFILGSTLHRIAYNKIRFLVSTFLIWFLVVSNVNVPDYMIRDWFTMFMIFSMLILIYGAIGFRVFLIGRGTMRIMSK